MSDERPDLAALLEHYDVDFNPMRVTQMVKCPLHEDRTPSLSINFDRQLWRCHSCGKAGDSFNLIMEKEECDFVRARAFATAQQLAAGAARGSDDEVRGSAYGGRRKVANGKGTQPRVGGYRPSWRR